MNVSDLDHVIIHVDDWDAAYEFYVAVLGLERVNNPEGAANPPGAWVCRLGRQQIISGEWREVERAVGNVVAYAVRVMPGRAVDGDQTATRWSCA